MLNDENNIDKHSYAQCRGTKVGWENFLSCSNMMTHANKV